VPVRFAARIAETSVVKRPSAASVSTIFFCTGGIRVVVGGTGEVLVVIDTVGELNVVPVAVCGWVVTGLVIKTVEPVGAMVVPTGDVVTGVPVAVLRGGSVEYLFASRFPLPLWPR
jgi:hypothetical protein